MAGPVASAGIKIGLRGLRRQVIVKLVSVAFVPVAALPEVAGTLLDDAAPPGVTAFVAGAFTTGVVPGRTTLFAPTGGVPGVWPGIAVPVLGGGIAPLLPGAVVIVRGGVIAPLLPGVVVTAPGPAGAPEGEGRWRR